MPIAQISGPALVYVMFDAVIDVLKTAYIDDNCNVANIPACMLQKLSTMDTRFHSFYNEDEHMLNRTMSCAAISGVEAKSTIEAEMLICVERLHTARCDT